MEADPFRSQQIYWAASGKPLPGDRDPNWQPGDTEDPVAAVMRLRPSTADFAAARDLIMEMHQEITEWRPAITDPDSPMGKRQRADRQFRSAANRAELLDVLAAAEKRLREQEG